MKKIKFILFVCLLINFFIIINVKAADPVFSLSACTNSNKVSIGATITCDVNVTYTELTINTVNFTINGHNSLDVTFEKSDGWTDNYGATKSNIKMYNASGVSGKIGTLKITTSDVVVVGVKSISLSDISMLDVSNPESTYTVTDIARNIEVVDNRDGNTNLSALKIDNVSVANFGANNREYSVSVSKQKVTITATSASNKSTVTGTGEKILREGANDPIEIVVRAENGSQKTYTLILTYTPKSNDNALKTLELYNGESKIDFKYETKTNTYNVEVGADVEKVTIKSTLNHDKASYVKNYGNRDVELGFGKNKIEIKVVAENGSEKVYSLNITRKDDRGVDATLSQLTVNGKDVMLLANVYEYKIDVRYVVEKSDIVVVTNDIKAKTEFENIDLVDGDNQVIIKVTSENGIVKEYKITIVRLTEEVSKVVLKNIEVKNYTLNFDINKKEYDITVEKDVKSLDIVVTPDTDIKLDVLGNENLKNASTIIMRITDDDGLKTYTINIHKVSDKILGFISINMFCYTIFGIGLLLLIISIVYCLRKKRN